MLKLRSGVLVATLAVVTAASFEALAQGRGPAAGAAPAARPSVATVGGRPVPRDEWQRRCESALAEFGRRNSMNEVPEDVRDLVRRQVLESQVRIELLVLEARRTGVTATVLEAEEMIKQDPFFNPGGKFDESRFLAVKTTQPEAFNAAVATARDQIAARKLNERVVARQRPAEEVLRREAERALSSVTLDYLGLARNDFEGTFREPRESEVLEWYRTHAADYRRPDRASLTVVFVNAPGLSDSIRALPGGAEAWTRRMKAIADSLLGEVAGGRTLEQAAGYLGPRPRTVVTSDNFPGYWRAGEETNRRLFDPANTGRVLPQALPAAEGWLLVRVDEIVPAHVAPLREVAREIRGLLRRDRRAHHDEYEERALHARLGDSLAAPAWRFRVAVLDTGDLQVREPSGADLERYYRGHLADYSAFDPKSGAIVSRPLAEVRDEIRARWFTDQRRLGTRLRAEELLRAWRSGRRDAKLETRAGARDLAPMVRGAAVLEAPGARALSDTVWAYADPRGPGMVAIDAGWVVWKAVEKLDRVVPTFEQARPLLAERLAAERAAADEAGARRLFEEDDSRFVGGPVVHFSRFAVPKKRPIDVSLTRSEIERYHAEHLDRYSSPELVTARHILVARGSDSPEADGAARARAAELLARARAGEDFATLARQYSDDPATKEQGGDLGTFGRGTMVDAFEHVVFALRAGEYASEPVRTPLGWHVVYCVDHAPAVVHPLDWIYTVVGGDAAHEKAEREAGARADSLVRVLRGPREARAAAERLGEPVQSLQKAVGELSTNAALAEYFRGLDGARPGEMVRRVDGLPGGHQWVTWVDSVGIPRRASWEQARGAAIEAYRRNAGRRALDAKQAELDSLFTAGWSLDSVAALWGGLERIEDAVPGRGLPNFGGAALLDSLVFGGAHAAALAVGQESGWNEFPNGWVRLRFTARTEASREQRLAWIENERSAVIERGLVEYFEGLKKRWPVRILDARMREVATTQPPPPRSGR